jgi:dihydropteroate synthase
MIWRISPAKSLDLSPGAEPKIIGILNVTPDSFSDGGRWTALDAAVTQAERMLAEGAVGIDVGGESTRPGAQRVPVDEQVRRVVPVIEAVRKRVGTQPIITVDTTRAHVARAALDAGADAVNDVSGGDEDPALLPLAAQRNRGVILMHRATTPELDSYSTAYGKPGERPAPTPASGDIVAEVKTRLLALAQRAVAAGVAWESIVLDPGLGFGKTVEQNLELIRRTGELVALGRPILSGLSRKSFTARAAGLPDDALLPPPAQRLDATVVLSRGHREAGARLFRVHDVKEHVQAFNLTQR